DQPYRTKVGDLVALPPTYELDDANALLQRKVTISTYGRMLVDAFNVLYRESVETGRLYLLHLRPWITGQPYRIGYVERALAHVAAHGQLWPASTDAMVQAFRESAGQD